MYWCSYNRSDSGNSTNTADDVASQPIRARIVPHFSHPNVKSCSSLLNHMTSSKLCIVCHLCTVQSFEMCSSFPYYSQYVCSVKPENRPRIATPVVAMVIEKPSQLADSFANNPVRIELKVNQVSLSCELATALHVASCVLYVYWQFIIQCVYCQLCSLQPSCGTVHVLNIQYSHLALHRFSIVVVWVFII